MSFLMVALLTIGGAPLLAARAPLHEAPEYPIKYSLRGHTDLKF